MTRRQSTIAPHLASRRRAAVETRGSSVGPGNVDSARAPPGPAGSQEVAETGTRLEPSPSARLSGKQLSHAHGHHSGPAVPIVARRRRLVTTPAGRACSNSGCSA